MGAVLFRARAELRRRRRAILALTLLVALATGTVLTAAAGARRTESSYRRLLEVSEAYDLEIDVIGDVDAAILDDVAALPQVAEHGRVAILPSDVAAEPGKPEGPFTWGLSAGTIIDGNLGFEFEKARVVAGRNADLEDATEAVVSEAFLRDRGLAVGDRFSFRVLTLPEMFELFSGRPVEPSLDPFTVTIVGVWRLPHDVAFVTTPGGIVYLTPAFYRAYGADLATLHLMYVRLHEGFDPPAFIAEGREIARAAGDPQGLSFGTQEQLVSQVQRSLTVQSVALWLFAGLAALTALLVVGQAIVRQLHASADDGATIRSLGFSRSGIAVSHLLVAAVPVVLGAVLGAGIAVALSPLMPIGLARFVEPSPGIALDWVVLALGAAGAAVVLALAVTPAALRLARRTSLQPPTGTGSGAGVASGVARMGAGPSAVVGVQMALARGGRRVAIPVRTSIAGAVAGIAAFVAALTFGSSFNHLLTTPAEYGWTWDLLVGGGEAASPGDQRFLRDKAQQVAARPESAAVTMLTVRHVQRESSAELTLFAFEDVEGSVLPRLIEGRLPAGRDEIAVGSAVLDEAGSAIGDDLVLPGVTEACGTDGCMVSFKIVGRTVLPSIDDTQQDEGAVVTSEGLTRIQASSGFVELLVRLNDGVPLERARAAFAADAIDVRGPQRSVELENLTRVRSMPMVLAGLLAVLALGALIHSLVLSVRERRRELAILKTIGFRRRQVAGAVAWQASTLILVSILMAIPLGVAAGRWTWERMNVALGVGVVPIVPVAVVSLGVLVVLALGNLVALMPASSAARTQPASVLRSE